MKKNYVITGLIIVCLALLFVNFKPTKTSIPKDYNEMTPWQILDVKIDLDNQIWTLDNKRKEVIKIYNDKRGFVEEPVKEVKTVEETPITQLNKALDLQ